MGIRFSRSVAELDAGLVLAPERYDPRRQVQVKATRTLADVAIVVTENTDGSAFGAGDRVLVLDTTHAYEGFVMFRHDAVEPGRIGSAKRRLRAGDVVISRLRPYLRQVAYIDERLFRLAEGGNAVVGSSEFYVIRGRPGFDTAALVPYLLSENVQTALAAGQEGGHHPRFNRDLLLSLPVPEFLSTCATDLAAAVKSVASGVLEGLLRTKGLVAAMQSRATLAHEVAARTECGRIGRE